MSDLPEIPISVLDIGPVEKGSSPAEALAATRDLAVHADQLGYTRFWVAEHHNAPNIATASPAVILAALGAVTTRIRLGSGGVMLPNHPPLVVAEQFGTLSAYHPGRIDLGIGRAPGTDPLAAQALRRLPVEAFRGELADLISFLTGEFADDHPHRTVTAVPGYGSDPVLWLLGSGVDSARLAGSLGLPFAFAHHIKNVGAVEALGLYRRAFRPSDRLAEPYAMISVQVVCAEDDEHARWLADPAQLSFLRMRTWPAEPFPSPADAAAHAWTPDERAAADERQAAQAIGGLDTVRRHLADILDRTRPDELMITSPVTDLAERLRSMDRVRALFSRRDSAARSRSRTAGS